MQNANSAPIGASTAGNVGKVTQVIGSTFDVEFAEDSLPAIYNAVQDRRPSTRAMTIET